MSASKTIVLITGANIGIGKATAQVLACSSAKYHIILGSRSVSKGEAALSEIRSKNPPGTLSLLELDITSDASIASALTTITHSFGRLDVLINNAGIGGLEDAPYSRAQFRSVYDTNTIGPAILTETLTPLLLKSSNPYLVFVSSSMGSISQKLVPEFHAFTPRATAYSLSKAALNHLAMHYYMELKDKGVKVHVMCPGLVESNLRRDRPPIPGALAPETSGETLRRIIEGERDGELGMFVHSTGGDGVYGW